MGQVWTGDSVDPDEREQLAVALAGREAPAAVELWRLLAEALGFADSTIVNAAQPDESEYRMHLRRRPVKGSTPNQGQRELNIFRRNRTNRTYQIGRKKKFLGKRGDSGSTSNNNEEGFEGGLPPTGGNSCAPGVCDFPLFCPMADRCDVDDNCFPLFYDAQGARICRNTFKLCQCRPAVKYCGTDGFCIPNGKCAVNNDCALNGFESANCSPNNQKAMRHL